MSCTNCGTGSTFTLPPGWKEKLPTAGCAAASASSAVASGKNIVVFGNTYSTVFKILKLIKKIRASFPCGSTVPIPKIYWLFPGANFGWANGVYGTTADNSSPSFGHEISSVFSSFATFPAIYSSSTSLDDANDDWSGHCEDADDPCGILQSSSVNYKLPIGMQIIGNTPEIVDFGLPTSSSTNASFPVFNRGFTYGQDYSPAEKAVVQQLQACTAACTKSSVSNLLITGGASWTFRHFYALQVTPDQTPTPQLLQQHIRKIYASRDQCGNRIVTLFPNLKFSCLKIVPDGNDGYTVSGRAGHRDFQLTNVGEDLIYWTCSPMTNLILKTYAYEQSFQSVRPMISVPVTAVASVNCPRYYQNLDLLGSNIIFSLSDPSICAGGNGVSNTYVRIDFSLSSPDQKIFTSDPETTIVMNHSIIYIAIRRIAHFDSVNGMIVTTLLDQTTESLLQTNASNIVKDTYNCLFGVDPPVPLTTGSGVCDSSGFCVSVSNFTTRPDTPTTLNVTLETIAELFKTALCYDSQK